MKRIDIAIAQEFGGTIYGPGNGIDVPDDFMLADPPSSGGGVSTEAMNTAIATALAGIGGGDFPGPRVTPSWGGGGKKVVFALANCLNGFGAGWGNPSADYLHASPFVFSKEFTLTRLTQRSLGNAGALIRMGIYASDPNSYEPRALLWGSAELNAAPANYLGSAGLSIAIEAGKVYWAAVWAGIADPQLYMKQSVADFVSARIVGSDYDDATTPSVGIKAYYPWIAATPMPANWPGPDVTGMGENAMHKTGNNAPLFFGGCD